MLVAVAICLIPFPGYDGTSAQSLTYSRGQNASPAFEGWEENPDGSFNFLFGYMNRNWEEELDVPIGPDNNIEPGGPDQGQPEYFYPRLSRYVFRVKVPKHFGGQELVWTLTAHGRTEKAYATLAPDLEIDEGWPLARNTLSNERVLMSRGSSSLDASSSFWINAA